MADGSGGQMTMLSLEQFFSTCPMANIQSQPVPPRMWQLGPTFPSTVISDIFYHIPAQLSSPEGWTMMERSCRVWIAEGDKTVTRMDAA